MWCPSGLRGSSSGTLTSGPITALASEGLGKGACESDGSGAGDRGSAALPYRVEETGAQRGCGLFIQRHAATWGQSCREAIHQKQRFLLLLRILSDAFGNLR